MQWKKFGRIWNTEGEFDWMQTHAAVPLVLPVDGDVFRFYFSARDGSNRSHCAYFDYDMSAQEIVRGPSEEPVLAPGSKGLFDDCGITLSCYVPELKYFYYLGWGSSRTVGYNNEIGLATAEGDGTVLTKKGRRPIFGKCEDEPFTFGYPWVTCVNGLYWMFYDVLLSWEEGLFDLRSAVSSDGINWMKTGVSSPRLEEGEGGIARPCVLHEDGIFKMWYSVKKEDGYEMGYAESPNGIVWNRLDHEVGIEKSSQGWDSEQIEHPVIFNWAGDRYMAYNGNGFGRTGIGLAILEAD